MLLPPIYTKEKNGIYAVIETPQGSRNKYDYNPQADFFELKKVLPSGTVFPLDFGFIPHTKGEDGDPLDVLVIGDFPLFPGCVLACRVAGVLMVKQKEKKGKAIRNDRIIAVSADSLNYSHIKDIADINKSLINEVIHFFEYYNEMEGKIFRLLGTGDKSRALEVIKKGRV